jgi:23S rRNA (pseudouridine1915-N3)-methyltransferase
MPMNLIFARIQPRRRSQSPAQALLDDYLARISRYQPAEVRDFPEIDAFTSFLDTSAAKLRHQLVLADSTGHSLTSEAFAAKLGDWIDRSVQQTVLAIGPPDGWPPALLQRANLTLSFGRMTLPHELAAVILAEQSYRALTILAGHPYHSGH